MCNFLILTFFYFIVVSAQEKVYFAFTEDEEFLAECIEDKLLKNDRWIKNVDIARLVSGKTRETFSLDKGINNFFKELRNKQISRQKKYFTSDFRIAIKVVAVKDCADDQKSIFGDKNKNYLFNKDHFDFRLH